MKNILVRYGELTLKGDNKHHFISTLLANIKNKLRDFKSDLVYKKDFNSLTIEVLNDKVVDSVAKNLQNIFGIYSISIVEITEKNIDKINDAVVKIAKKYSDVTFKIEAERKDKTFEYDSMEIKKIVSGAVLKNVSNFTVDLHNPKLYINIVIKKDGAYIFDNRVKCLGGLPVGVTGRGLSLLSGGIDSPVSSYLAMKRGLRVDFLHFITPPHTKPESLEKTKTLAKELKRYNFSSFNLYVCDFGDFLNEIVHIKDESYRITIMRRAFIKIANILAKEIGAHALITGESLGQVASQTIESINTINTVSDIPIIRPLITYDKSDIIEISKKINTYETSILPFDDACSLFVPKKPVTRPKIDIAEQQEKGILFDQFVELTAKSKIVKYFVDENGEWNEKK